MKKFLYVLLALSVILALNLGAVLPVSADNGSIKTTDSSGNVVNENVHYASKTAVYFNGDNLDAGDYWAQVTSPEGDILGKTLTASVHVSSNGLISNIQLWSILYRASSSYTLKGYDNTPNNGGEYKLWISQDSAFSGGTKKSDNFKVTRDRGTIKIVKNTVGGDGIFAFKTTGGHGLPADFSITTSNGLGLQIYDVELGSYSVTETVPEGWTLSSVPGSFTVAVGDVHTVTFTNTKKISPAVNTLINGTIPEGQTPEFSDSYQVFDNATVVPNTATGTVSFYLYNSGNNLLYTFPDRPLVNGVATSGLTVPLSAGSYYWKAKYNGSDVYLATYANQEPFIVQQKPGGPVPELPTVALLGLGLAGIGAFMVIRRRQESAR
jgi:hypothetical protein